MVTKNECPGAIAGKTDQNNYTAPEITILELTLEKGFAASSDSAPDDWEPTNW